MFSSHSISPSPMLGPKPGIPFLSSGEVRVAKQEADTIKDSFSFCLYGLLGKLNFIILIVCGRDSKVEMTLDIYFTFI